VNTTLPETAFGTVAVSVSLWAFSLCVSFNDGSTGGIGVGGIGGTVTLAVAALAGPPRPAVSINHSRTP